MSRARTRALLLAVVAAELIVGGVLAARRLGRVEPPVPDLADADPVAAAEFRRLAADCRTAGGWAALGEAYLANGYFPEAETCFRQAADLDAANPEFAFRHAFALERIGRLDEANAQYRAAVARNHPREEDCRYYIDRNFLRLEQPEHFPPLFSESALPAARYERALLLARAGQAEQADFECELLAREFPGAYHPVSLRYRLALARNDRPAAERFADEFFRRPAPLPSPFDAEVRWVFEAADGFGRARLFRDAGREVQEGRSPAAEELLRAALAARWEPEVADRLGEVVLALGRPAEAVHVLAESVDRGPAADTLWRLGRAQEAAGRPDLALAAWDRAARFATGPQVRDLWGALAARYDASGEPDRAKPLHARAHLCDGLTELAAGRLDEAVGALRQAVEADPRLAAAWCALGDAQRLAGRTADARDAYDQCLKVDPDYGRAIRGRRLLGG